MCDAVIIATVGASMMGIKAQQEAAYAEVQAVEMQKQQLSEQAEASRIEMLQKANDRKREAMSAIARNEAQLTAMGVTFDSPSYQALKKSNVATVKRDLGRIGMSQFDKEQQWLLCNKNEIMWVVGRRTDRRYSKTNKSNMKIEVS